MYQYFIFQELTREDLQLSDRDFVERGVIGTMLMIGNKEMYSTTLSMQLVKSYRLIRCISVIYWFLQFASFKGKTVYVVEKDSLRTSYVTCCCLCEDSEGLMFYLIRNRRLWPHFPIKNWTAVIWVCFKTIRNSNLADLRWYTFLCFSKGFY